MTHHLVTVVTSLRDEPAATPCCDGSRQGSGRPGGTPQGSAWTRAAVTGSGWTAVTGD